MAELKKLLSDSVVYGLSSIVGRFLNYLLVPLYTYHIAASSGGYGVVTNIYAHVALLLVLLTFGMETTYFYFVNRPEADRRRVFGTALGAVAAVGAVFVVAVMALLGPVSRGLGYADHPEYIAAMALVVAMDASQSICFARLRQEGRAWKFAALKLAFIVGNIGLNLLVFLVAPSIADRPWMQWYDPADNVGYIFYINLMCTSLVWLGFIPELKGFKFSIFDTQLLKQMLRYTWPLLLLGVVGILNQVADKQLFPYLVPGDEGRVQLGIYGACAKIAMIMAMITQAFRYAYEPFVFGMGGPQGDKRRTQAVVMKYFVAFTLLAFLAVVGYMDLLKYIIRSDYWEGLRAVPVVMLAEILMGVYFNLSFWYKLSGKTWWGAVMSAVGCAVLVGANIAFVPRYGYMACAWAGVAGYGVCVLLSYFIGRRHEPIPYPLRSIGLYAGVALALFAVMQWVRPEAVALRLALNTLLLAAYAAMVLFLERDTLLRPIIKRLKR